MSTENPIVVDVPEESRYELRVGRERVGLADYSVDGDVVTIPHTEVDPAHGGKGFGGILVRGALDDIRSKGAKVVPTCPFVDSWITKHPDYEDLRA